MKYALTLISLLFCATSQAQVSASEHPENKGLTIVQVLTGKDHADKHTLRLLTEEKTVQIHDGEEVYRTLREVEYLIKETDKKITTKRKVLSSRTEAPNAVGEAGKVFPDMTDKLLSAVCSPHTIKKDKERPAYPYAIGRNRETETTSVMLDKLALMNPKGSTAAQGMGANLTFDVATEELSYGTLSESLYFDALKEIKTYVALTSKEKSGAAHKIEVKEQILVKSLIKE